MTLLAYLSSQPAVKVSLLQLLKTRQVVDVYFDRSVRPPASKPASQPASQPVYQSVKLSLTRAITNSSIINALVAFFKIAYDFSSSCFRSGNAKNDDLLFPSLLPSMLSCLKGSSENQMVSRSQYCVVVWNFCFQLLEYKYFVNSDKRFGRKKKYIAGFILLVSYFPALTTG